MPAKREEDPVQEHLNSCLEQNIKHDNNRGYYTTGSPREFLIGLTFEEKAKLDLKQSFRWGLRNEPPSETVSLIPKAQPAKFTNIREEQQKGQEELAERIAHIGKYTTDPFLNDLAVTFQEPERPTDNEQKNTPDSYETKMKNTRLYQGTWRTIENIINSELSETIQDNAVTAIIHAYSHLKEDEISRHNYGYCLGQIGELLKDETIKDPEISQLTDLMTVNTTNSYIGGKLIEFRRIQYLPRFPLYSNELSLLNLITAMSDTPDEYLTGYEKISLLEQITRQIENFPVENESTLAKLITEFIKEGKLTDPTKLLSLMELAQTNPALAERILDENTEDQITPEETMVTDLLDYIRSSELRIHPELSEIIHRVSLTAKAARYLETKPNQSETSRLEAKLEAKREILSLLQGEIYKYIRGEDDRLEISVVLDLIDTLSLSTPFLQEGLVEETFKAMVTDNPQYTLEEILRKRDFNTHVSDPKEFNPRRMKESIATRRKLIQEALETFINYTKLSLQEESPISQEFMKNLNLYMTELIPGLMNLREENLQQLIARVKALSYPIRQEDGKLTIAITHPELVFDVYDIALDTPYSIKSTQHTGSFMYQLSKIGHSFQPDEFEELGNLLEKTFSTLAQENIVSLDGNVRKIARHAERARILREGKIEDGYFTSIDYMVGQLEEKAVGNIQTHIENIDHTALQRFETVMRRGKDRRQSRLNALEGLDRLFKVNNNETNFTPYCPGIDKLAETETIAWNNIRLTLEKNYIKLDHALNLVSNGSETISSIKQKTGLTTYQANMLIRLYNRIESAYESTQLKLYLKFIGTDTLKDDETLADLLHTHVGQSNFKRDAARNYITTLFEKTEKDSDDGFAQISRLKRKRTLEIERLRDINLMILSLLGASDEKIIAENERFDEAIKNL